MYAFAVFVSLSAACSMMHIPITAALPLMPVAATSTLDLNTGTDLEIRLRTFELERRANSKKGAPGSVPAPPAHVAPVSGTKSTSSSKGGAGTTKSTKSSKGTTSSTSNSKDTTKGAAGAGSKGPVKHDTLCKTKRVAAKGTGTGTGQSKKKSGTVRELDPNASRLEARKLYIDKKWFHGTCKDFADSIEKSGFKFNEDRRPGDFSYKGGVYLTIQFENAVKYVPYFKDCGQHGGDVVMEFELDVERLEADEKARNVVVDILPDDEARDFNEDNLKALRGGPDAVPKHVKSIVDSTDIIVGTVPLKKKGTEAQMTNPFTQGVFLTPKGLEYLTLKMVHSCE